MTPLLSGVCCYLAWAHCALGFFGNDDHDDNVPELPEFDTKPIVKFVDPKPTVKFNWPEKFLLGGQMQVIENNRHLQSVETKVKNLFDSEKTPNAEEFKTQVKDIMEEDTTVDYDDVVLNSLTDDSVKQMQTFWMAATGRNTIFQEADWKKPDGFEEDWEPSVIKKNREFKKWLASAEKSAEAEVEKSAAKPGIWETIKNKLKTFLDGLLKKETPLSAEAKKKAVAAAKELRENVYGVRCNVQPSGGRRLLNTCGKIEDIVEDISSWKDSSLVSDADLENVVIKLAALNTDLTAEETALDDEATGYIKWMKSGGTKPELSEEMETLFKESGATSEEDFMTKYFFKNVQGKVMANYKDYEDFVAGWKSDNPDETAPSFEEWNTPDSSSPANLDTADMDQIQDSSMVEEAATEGEKDYESALGGKVEEALDNYVGQLGDDALGELTEKGMTELMSEGAADMLEHLV